MILFLISLFVSCEYKTSWLVSGIYGWGFATKDSLLYATSGYGVDILNISNPSEPRLISSIMTPGLPFDLAIADELLYICDDYVGVRIFDIQNPALPVEISSFDTPGSASKIFVNDTIAYVADDWYGLRIIDIRNPFNPVELGFYDTPGRTIWVDVVDTLAYISDFGNGLIILNVKEPTNPQFVGQWQNPNLAYIWAVDAKDTLVYLSGQYLIPPQFRHFMVLNGSNPTTPFYVSGIRLPESPYGFIIKDTIAFVCTQRSGIRLINIANPLNMYEINYVPGFHYYNLAVSNFQLYTAFSTYGTYNDHCVKIYDVSNLNNIVPIGQFFPGPFIMDVSAKDNMLFVLALKEYANIIAFNCTEPESIIFVDSLMLSPGSSGCLTYDSPYVYVGHGGSWSILEFSNNSLYHITTINRPAEVTVKKNNYLITGTCAQRFGLCSYDITNPSVPSATDSLPIRCTDIVVVDSFAYVCYDGRLYVVNISNPSNLFLTCSLNTGHYPHTIAKIPPYLVIGNGDWCLQIVDISQPANPQIINSIPTSVTNRDCVIRDSLLFVGGSYKGVFIYDVSNPVSPILIDSCDTPGWAYKIATVDNYLYVADNVCLGLIKYTSLSISENRQIFSENELSIYPNPFAKILNIEYKSGCNKKNILLKIYDTAGRQVKQFNLLTNYDSPIIWSCDDNRGQKVSNGVYFIHLETTNGEVVLRKKVVKVE